MPKYQNQSSANDDELRDLVGLTSDPIAVEKACQLIDSYIRDTWQEPPMALTPPQESA